MNVTSPKIRLHPEAFHEFKKTSVQSKRLKDCIKECFNHKKNDYYDKSISVEIYVYIEKSRVCGNKFLLNHCLNPVLDVLIGEKIVQEANIKSLKITRVKIDTSKSEGVIIKLIKCPSMECASVLPGKNTGSCKNYIPFL